MLTLNFEQSARDGNTIRALRLEGAGIERRLPGSIRFEFPGEPALPAPAVLDGALLSVIFIAMQLGAPLRVRGPLSAQALRNVRLYQEAWACLKPERYRVVEIEPDRAVPARELPRAGAEAAISGFSGGLDSTFTVLRHRDPVRGNAAFDVKAVLMVHGFDVRCGNQVDFDGLRRRTAPLLEELGVDSLVMRTDARVHEPQDWEDSFAAQLAGALHQFSHRFDFGLIASSSDYLRPATVSLGSKPALNYLLSGGALEVVHDGSGYSRTAKAAVVARSPTALKTLRVCWQGEPQDRNCGHCEKCMRTRLSLLAVGVSNPPCFDAPLDLARIDTIECRSRSNLEELVTIAEYARGRGIAAAWLDRLEARIRRGI